MLSAFDGARPLNEVISHFPIDLQPLGIEIVIWLIRYHLISDSWGFILPFIYFPFIIGFRWRIIVESNTYLLRVTTSDDDGGIIRKDSSAEATPSSKPMPIPMPASLGNIAKGATGLTKEEIMVKLGPYLDGKTNLFEMLWRENLEESEVLEIVADDPSIMTLVCSNSE